MEGKNPKGASGNIHIPVGGKAQVPRIASNDLASRKWIRTPLIDAHTFQRRQIDRKHRAKIVRLDFEDPGVARQNIESAPRIHSHIGKRG